MKRAGFTMIELIFVIVILGILAAVALPKFAGVSDQANASKCSAFVGTLNRTVGPSMWSASIANGLQGVTTGIKSTGAGDYLDLDTYMEKSQMPFECFATGTGVGTVTDITAVGQLGKPTFGTTSYSFDHNSSGTISESPVWDWRRL